MNDPAPSEGSHFHSFGISMRISKSSKTESVAGSFVTEIALTAVGAAAGGVLAPLLPVLAKSLASERQRKRVEVALEEIASTLNNHEEKIKTLSDEQYKLINETVLTILQTTQADKLKYLRDFVENTLNESEMLPQEACVLSRIIRDISAEEIEFLLIAYRYTGLALTNIPQPSEIAEDNS
ncbi:hypothetical protein HZU83_13985 [Sphaerotilus montanus]|uniref:Uncharacterized protein n=1 Tax=Sphaerotilus montanus TaxID=522889 RepID=A0A7Y9U7D4_9BURK|nr:hypothetical protein [Sphaerotilus montanus]NYG35023.1 hypothetical protein [Sphaerotilus montanus]NZD57801.1 hypothetical protein [Sphaerotilus montanus]